MSTKTKALLLADAPGSKMTAGRAMYFMERFKREEKMLGPNEQAALDFVISMLEKQAEPVQAEERERIASQWDGCVTHQLDAFGPVDIGASIRAGELVEASPMHPVASATLSNL